MEAYERDYHDDSSSFDEILDFDSIELDEENDKFFAGVMEENFYRHLDEY